MAEDEMPANALPKNSTAAVNVSERAATSVAAAQQIADSNDAHKTQVLRRRPRSTTGE